MDAVAPAAASLRKGNAVTEPLSLSVSARARRRTWLNRRLAERRGKKNTSRLLALEPLEIRALLNAAPLAVPDLSYSTPANTPLLVNNPSQGLKANDSDPEGAALSITIVTNPASGTLSNVSSTDGTFTYTPNSGFNGIDGFTYKANDGSQDSNVVTASIAVGGHFGARTNLEEVARGGFLMTGGLELAQPLTPGLELVYRSDTVSPKPIVVLETFLTSYSSVPNEVRAQLTFNGSAGTDYSYSTSGLQPGQALRFALQADAASLATGRYAHSVTLTARFGSNNVTRTYSGQAELK
jgi:hypothetical protein